MKWLATEPPEMYVTNDTKRWRQQELNVSIEYVTE